MLLLQGAVWRRRDRWDLRRGCGGRGTTLSHLPACPRACLPVHIIYCMLAVWRRTSVVPQATARTLLSLPPPLRVATGLWRRCDRLNLRRQAAAFGGIMYGKGAYERGRRYSVQQDRNDPLMPGAAAEKNRFFLSLVLATPFFWWKKPRPVGSVQMCLCSLTETENGISQAAPTPRCEGEPRDMMRRSRRR